jgi:DNA-binding LacI/PurR family transcriptional regulator
MGVNKSTRRTYDLTQRSQVSRAARELIRFIYTQNLGVDDRLPPQSELVQKIEFSNDTLSEAMRALVDAGVLTRKRRVGTVVSDRERPVRGLWRVGVAVFSAICLPFYAQLLQRVLSRLNELGCSSTLHMLTPGCDRRPPVLGDFGALEADLEDGVISGVISFSDLALSDWRRVDRLGIPICHVSAWEKAPCGVVIDQAPMVQQAVSLLLTRSCRRLTLVRCGSNEVGYNRGQLAYEATVGAAGLGERSQRVLVAGEGSHGGARIADTLLELSPKERPDGLVVLNDWVGMGLAARLAEVGSYRPTIVVQSNMQAPLAFAFPVVHFEVDVDQIATQSVDMLLERMRNPLIPGRREWIAPQLSMAEPSQMVG